MEHDGPNTGAYTQKRKNAADQFSNHQKHYETTKPAEVHPEKYNQTYPRLKEELSKKRSTARVNREKQEVGFSRKKKKQLSERRPADARWITKRHNLRQCKCRKCREANKKSTIKAIMCSTCCGTDE